MTKFEAILVSHCSEAAHVQTRCSELSPNSKPFQSVIDQKQHICKPHTQSIHTAQPRLLLSPAGSSVDSSAKKSKPGLAPGPDSAYNPADSSDLPSWITERVRLCQRLAPASAPPPPQPTPEPHPPAPAQQHQHQPPASSPASAAFNQSSSSKPEFVLYWMRTALRGHENPALVCLPTSQRSSAMLSYAIYVYHSLVLWLPV